jgi:hypothetical protein
MSSITQVAFAPTNTRCVTATSRPAVGPALIAERDLDSAIAVGVGVGLSVIRQPLDRERETELLSHRRY